ncbi:hypothetical protein E2C01_049153 [Portunus trituberculatus]|uniref:Uncharacterized protein n=1 Tax=Portunus trituberculatus TaxID=210409 RepID=A0A5B7G5F3_PORTR|nr:hypothetical protein [Portunus trituberculatus]
MDNPTSINRSERHQVSPVQHSLSRPRLLNCRLVTTDGLLVTAFSPCTRREDVGGWDGRGTCMLLCKLKRQVKSGSRNVGGGRRRQVLCLRAPGVACLHVQPSLEILSRCSLCDVSVLEAVQGVNESVWEDEGRC